MTTTSFKTTPRDHLAIALDTSNLDTAVSIAKAVQLSRPGSAETFLFGIPALDEMGR